MEETKQRLAEKLLREADEAADTLAEKRAAASYRDTHVGIGIAVDKALLLTRQPTEITERRESYEATVKVVFERLCKLGVERARELGEEPPTRAEIAARLVEYKPEVRELLRDELCEQIPEIKGVLAE